MGLKNLSLTNHAFYSIKIHLEMTDINTQLTYMGHWDQKEKHLGKMPIFDLMFSVCKKRHKAEYVQRHLCFVNV